MPRAINSVIIRIGLFYVGSVILLSLLLPYTAFKKGESPFLTSFSSIGVQGVDSIMNLVVLTAALSSLNAGLYSTGRILRSMAAAGSAPKFALRMSKFGVPCGGIVITAVVALLVAPLNYILPGEAFEIGLSVAAVCIVTTWRTNVLCQIQLQCWAGRGWLKRPSFRTPGTPFTGYLTLVFLAWVLVMVLVQSPRTLLLTVVSLVLIVCGWFACRGRIMELAEVCSRYTGPAPAIANRPPA
jgi:L-asparagine permease